MDTPYEGYIDNDGWQCRKFKPPVELWESPNGGYCVYLTVEQKRFLHARRLYEEDALRLFDEVCGMLK